MPYYWYIISNLNGMYCKAGIYPKTALIILFIEYTAWHMLIEIFTFFSEYDFILRNATWVKQN